MFQEIDKWKDKIISITLFMKSDRSYHDLTIYHKVLGKAFQIDKDTITNLYNRCDYISVHVLLTDRHHVLPLNGIDEIIELDEDAFFQYLYDRILGK